MIGINVNGSVIGMSNKSSQQLDVIATFEDNLWVRSRGDGSFHIIKKCDIQSVEIDNNMSVNVNVNFDSETAFV